jgi:hypothetical protein
VKDSELKELLFRHHWAQRHYAQPEVEIYSSGGAAETARMITDIDVLALRPHPDLYFERLLGDCRTLRSQSAVNRALWLSGLMRFFGARSGTVLLRAEVGVEPDHKLVAQRVGVQLFSHADFVVYDRAVVYPSGSSFAGVTVQDLRDLREANAKYGRLRPLLGYLYRDAWQEPTYRSVIRRLIGTLREVSGEFDPEKLEHVVLLCDAASIFAVALADCAGRIFQQFLHPARKEDLAESLRLYLWDGRSRYSFVEQVRQKHAESLGATGAELGPLDLPEWNEFVQLVRHLLEQPREAFSVPWLLRQCAVDLFRSRAVLAAAVPKDAISLKQAMLTASYFCKASGVPKDFGDILTTILIKVQTGLVSPQATASPSRG